MGECVRRRRIVSGCNDAVGHNTLEELRGWELDHFRKSRKVAERRLGIGTSRSHVGDGGGRERHGQRCTAWRHMLERRSCCQTGRDPRFAHELPSIQGVEEVDETWSAVQ